MKTEKSYIAWQGAWRLRVETISLPDGTTLERAYIEHPGSVVLVPLRPRESGYEVLMLQQFRPSLQTTILELPAGTREPDEPWLACAQRELREETGFRADSLISLDEVWPAPGVSDELMHIYLAMGLHHDPLPADVDEEIEVRPMGLDELVHMTLDGRMQDGKSVVALLRTNHYLYS